MKQEVIIEFKPMYAAIWLSDLKTGRCHTNIIEIDEDPEIRKLNKKAGDLYNSFIVYNETLTDFWVDKERQRINAKKMLKFLTELKNRITFLTKTNILIDDRESMFYEALSDI